MSIDTTPSAPWSPRPAATSAAVEPTQTGPAADIWTLLDELAALGRALRLLAEDEAAAARPELAGSATTTSAMGDTE